MVVQITAGCPGQDAHSDRPIPFDVLHRFHYGLDGCKDGGGFPVRLPLSLHNLFTDSIIGPGLLLHVSNAVKKTARVESTHQILWRPSLSMNLGEEVVIFASNWPKVQQSHSGLLGQ
jgi:hypothetical protein